MKKPRAKTCQIPACGRPHKAKGLCSAHYQRLRHGWSLRHSVKARLVGSTADRLKAYTDEDPLTGCHIWMGWRELHGYGRMGVKGRSQMVHRVAWELANGPIPDGKIVMHTCDNRRCCNPEHLKLGTHGENLRDRLKKGRGKG
ncbi:MAG TPA: HNH endonuclease signature motif containing protein, partial [Caulobacteraceae bacterium]